MSMFLCEWGSVGIELGDISQDLPRTQRTQ